MPTRRQLNLKYELPAHTDLSDKYDFLYDYNTRKGYVALKDSDDWREIENMSDEVRDVLSKMPIIKKEGDEEIPLMHVNRWSEETKNKYRKYKEEIKYLDDRGPFTKLIDKIHQFILNHSPEKDKYVNVMANPDGTIVKWYKYNKKGGRLVSRNLVERFQKGKAIKGALKVIYNTLATPIHAVFGTPGKRRGYNGGRFGGAGVSGKWSDPTYSYNEIHPADTLFVPVTQTFNDAFADARRRGLDTFEFNGGTYGTELGDNPNWEAAGNARTRDAVIPVPIPADTIRKTSDFPRNDTIITDVAYRRYPISTSNINKIFNK